MLLLQLPLLQIVEESHGGTGCIHMFPCNDWCLRVGCVCVLLYFLFNPYHIPCSVGEKQCFPVSVF